MADIFDFNYILISNFDIKDSELSNLHDFSNIISLQFPCLYSEKYDPYILEYFERNNFMNHDYNIINKKIDIYNIAGFHYIENFANLNDHIFYLGELNEYYYKKSSSLVEDLERLRFEDNENNQMSKLKSKNKISFKEELDLFLTSQISNHMIHFVDPQSKAPEIETDFANMNLYDQENCLSVNNSKMKSQGMGNFDGVDTDHPNWNFSVNVSNFSESKSLAHSSLTFLNSTGVKLCESLSNCQKVILLSGYVASELPQKYDSVIFKSTKKTNISSKVNNIFYLNFLKFIYMINFTFRKRIKDNMGRI